MPRSSSSFVVLSVRLGVCRVLASKLFCIFCLALCVGKNANVLALALACVYSSLQFSQSVYEFVKV